MNRRQLVKDAIAHKVTERVPYCIQFTRHAREKLETDNSCHSSEAWIDNDIVLVSPPWWNWHNIGPEWQNMEPPGHAPGVTGTRSYPEFFEQIKLLRDHSDKYILACIYGSHFEKANFLRGIENFLADLAGEPAFARKLLNRIITKNMVMLENILGSREIDGVLLGSDWGTQLDLLMSPDTWEDLIRPGEQREYDLIHEYGKDVWVHSCGNIVKVIPSLIEMGLDVLNPVQPECMDLAALKADFGDRLTFWGGISTQQALPYGAPDEVKAEARRVRDLMSTHGGYIFAPAQEIQDDVPLANVEALLAVAQSG
ncbi:MAG: hypothetical protein JW951_03995 [Lentisphaerae bacterium]|nr:hypothetical protein [Lentisphaerota bacterium]